MSGEGGGGGRRVSTGATAAGGAARRGIWAVDLVGSASIQGEDWAWSL